MLADEIKLGNQQGNWKTEAVHESIKAQLKSFTDLIATSDLQNLKDLVSNQIKCSDLRPDDSDLQRKFHDQNLQVFRPVSTFQASAKHEGLAELVGAIGHLTSPFESSSKIKINFKVFKVKLIKDQAESEVYVDTDGANRTSGVQQNMTWRCRWKRTDLDWKLSSILLKKFEEVHFRSSSGRELFSDCTKSVLSANDSFKNHLQHGIDHWRFRIEERYGIDSVSLAGLAIGDVNGDGLDDFYYCDVGGLPNRLFVQQPNGTAVDRSATAGVDWLDRSHGALFADLDNDGDQDLIVSAGSRLLLMENDGSGKFTLRTRLKPFPTAHSITAIDYDSDGLLDIYVCSYGNSLETFADSQTPLPWHDANNGAPNSLFRNESAWKFRNVTSDVGLDENNRRFSYAASWCDFDRDGDQDLYVANDFGRNNLFVNDLKNTPEQAARFHDAAREFHVEDISPGMSADWGDYNNDGRMDLYISNMFSSAGNRVTYQDRFMPGTGEELVGSYRRFARGNTLFQQEVGAQFKDVSINAGVTLGRWAWSSLFADINNDGWQDLLVANGHVTGMESDDL